MCDFTRLIFFSFDVRFLRWMLEIADNKIGRVCIILRFNLIWFEISLEISESTGQ